MWPDPQGLQSEEVIWQVGSNLHFSVSPLPGVLRCRRSVISKLVSALRHLHTDVLDSDSHELLPVSRAPGAWQLPVTLQFDSAAGFDVFAAVFDALRRRIVLCGRG